MLDKLIPYVRIGSLLILVLLVVMMFLVSPAELGPFGLTAWFTALMIGLSGVFVLVLMRWKYGSSREGFYLSLRRSFLISMWLVAILALGSLRQLGIRDIILLTILGLLIDFYMQRVQK